MPIIGLFLTPFTRSESSPFNRIKLAAPIIEKRKKGMSMNLWNYFPDFLSMSDDILKLPYLTIPFYLYVLYVTISKSRERLYLIVFLLLTLAASAIMIKNLGPQFGQIIPPLALLLVIAMPLTMLLRNLYCRSYRSVGIWFMVTIAGLLHGISWSLWLFALAGS